MWKYGHGACFCSRVCVVGFFFIVSEKLKKNRKVMEKLCACAVGASTWQRRCLREVWGLALDYFKKNTRCDKYYNGTT